MLTSLGRLVFLDQTVERMIKRFEDEYPETRLDSNDTSPPSEGPTISDSTAALEAQGLDTEQAQLETAVSDDEDVAIWPTLSRHNSDVSLTSKVLSQEEGRMLRSREILTRYPSQSPTQAQSEAAVYDSDRQD